MSQKMPTHGGSYIRDPKTGDLRKVEDNGPDAAAETPKPDAPPEPPAAKALTSEASGQRATKSKE